MHNIALVVFLSLTQLPAMITIPEEEELTAAQEAEVVLDSLTKTKKIATLSIKIMHGIPLPEVPINFDRYMSLIPHIRNTIHLNVENEAYRAYNRLPKHIREEIDNKSNANVPINNQPDRIVNPFEVPLLKRLNEAYLVQYILIMFNHLQASYPDVVLGTFEEFWNNGND